MLIAYSIMSSNNKNNNIGNSDRDPLLLSKNNYANYSQSDHNDDDEENQMNGPQIQRTLSAPHDPNRYQNKKLLNKESFSSSKGSSNNFDNSSTGTGSSSGQSNNNNSSQSSEQQQSSRFLYYLIYAMVNLIISAPGLYGYAAVIFNHPIYNNNMNALSKLVLFSSCIHQLGFFLFSSLDFAIGTVQDAGLIFLSSMANDIANEMIQDGHTEQEIISTTLVLLSLGTALLGLVLIGIGKAKWADAVSYLPMPVVGGYLAFIGYFCVQAGVALCISRPLVAFADWKYLFLDNHNMLLAFPGLVAGLILTMTTRLSTNDAFLPFMMVSIPALFYVVIYTIPAIGGIEGARDAGWVGPQSPPVPVSELFNLVDDWSTIRWDLAAKILPTWVGMVFVVAFASCLDVAAISIDMGQALDTNRELATVGVCNFMSGLTFGFTGSYIFSQTIFTYRTGVHSKWIGVFIMIGFMYIVTSPVNMLEVAPLFFLGSTLIFIGYDLLYEWLWEIRYQIFLSEYVIVWLTFIAIQIVGIDAGIILGVLVAILEQVILTAKTSAIVPVDKRSRAIYTPEQSKLLQHYAYNSTQNKRHQQIVTLEIYGTVFFGSSLMLLNKICDEIGVNNSIDGGASNSINNNDNNTDHSSISANNTNNNSLRMPRSPHPRSPYRLYPREPPQGSGGTITSPIMRNRSPKITMGGSKNNGKSTAAPSSSSSGHHHRPDPSFVVLDLMHISHLDASATRACFLQLIKMCTKQNKIVVASGATPRIEWLFRNHTVAYESIDDELKMKAQLQSRNYFNNNNNNNNNSHYHNQGCHNEEKQKCERILLFVTVQEALEFCETALLHKLNLQHNIWNSGSNAGGGGITGGGGFLQPRQYDPSKFLKPTQEVNRGKTNNDDGLCALGRIIAHILGYNNNSAENSKRLQILQRLIDHRHYESMEFHLSKINKKQNTIFERETHSDSFYIVLQGAVANYTGSAKVSYRQKQPIVSGAGYVNVQNDAMYRVTSKSDLLDDLLFELEEEEENDGNNHEDNNNSPLPNAKDSKSHQRSQNNKKKKRKNSGSPTKYQAQRQQSLSSMASGDGNIIATVWGVGSIFGYLDYLLERPRSFSAIATQNKTIVAKITHSHMALLQSEDSELHATIQQVLLHASTLDLANCTCDDV